MIVRASPGPSTPRPFTRDEYERLGAEGFFGPDERVELVLGEILAMPPQGTRHTTVVHLVAGLLEAAFGPGHYVRVQSPIALGPDSEPEPDVAVVVGSPDDYLAEHPKTALLIVEVSESTLAFDRGRKAALYARAKVPEYWIANLVDGVLEVHRDPQESRTGEWAYAELKRLKPVATVQPLAAPSASLKVSDLLR